MSRYFLGIDPGQSGAFGLLTAAGAFVAVWDAPANPDDAADLLRGVLIRAVHDGGPGTKPGDVTAVLERAQAMPKQGVSSTFSYGVGYGVLQGVLAMAGVSRVFVTSRRWKGAMGLTSDKEQARALARRTWPDAELERKKDHGRAEALLIAEWGRRHG